MRRANITSTRLTRRITLVDHSQFSPFIHLSLSLGNISSLKGVPLKELNLRGCTNIGGASPHQHERINSRGLNIIHLVVLYLPPAGF